MTKAQNLEWYLACTSRSVTASIDDSCDPFASPPSLSLSQFPSSLVFPQFVHPLCGPLPGTPTWVTPGLRTRSVASASMCSRTAHTLNATSVWGNLPQNQRSDGQMSKHSPTPRSEHACVRTCVCVCVCACERAWGRARVRLRVTKRD